MYWSGRQNLKQTFCRTERKIHETNNLLHKRKNLKQFVTHEDKNLNQTICFTERQNLKEPICFAERHNLRQTIINLKW